MNVPQRSFWIWFSPRTGSTLLCKGLEQTGVAGKAGEFFNFETGTLRDLHAAKDYESLRRHLWQIGSSPNGVMGIKYSLFRHSYDAISAEIRELRGLEDTHPLDWSIWADLFPNCQHIYLTRRNKVRQSVSWWKAIQDNQWHRLSAEQHARPADFYADKYNFDALSHLYRESMLREAATEAFFAHNEIKPLTVVYEDLVRDYAGTIGRLLDAINGGSDQVRILPPFYQPTANIVSVEWVQRFREELQQGWEKPAW